MGRALLVLDTPAVRQKAVDWIGRAPLGTRVEFKASKRTLPQNDMLWALLTEVSQQLDHAGSKYDPSQWKAIFLHAFGREVSFLPSLDRKTFLPLELSSSDLSKDEMTDFIEFIMKEAGERGVLFKDHRQQDQSNPGEESPSASAGEDAPAGGPASQDGGSSAASPSSNHFEWLQSIARMLWAGTFTTDDIDENLRLLECQKLSAFAAHRKPNDCPQEIVGKAASAYGYCQRVASRTIERGDGLALVAGVVGCDQDDLIGERA
ncbi:recombination protein NinB [Rhizobium sp. ARZ01]|uniref:recombination protein NinB n=1 Tax=Rhizobium sp. ARZ01 TaxID=2769313 RepID=UPI0017854D56|nr:recombination protein NinB [Rhizobium sp. ARZ01]MBD9372807.1 recombination protein NinB [Rhizobium sp. ARZ01]